MSIKWTIVLAGIAVLGFGALLSAIPGSPVWRIFNPAITVNFLDPNAPRTAGAGATAGRQLEIITLLPKDAIPAIMEKDLNFLDPATAARQVQLEDRIIGVSINGDHRAYSISHLSSHEVVNDTIGGIPVAVTW